MTTTTTRSVKSKTKTPTGHEVRDEWKHSCFFLAECICGKTMWATSEAELNKKWKEHMR